MSNLDDKALNDLEELCKIKLTTSERVEFSKKLKQVLDYVEQLNEINTEDVDACNYVLMDMQKNVFREDEIEPGLSRDVFLSNAPDQVAGMIKVPEILVQKD